MGWGGGEIARTEEEDEAPGTVAYEEEEDGRAAPTMAERDDKLEEGEEKEDGLEGKEGDAVRE